MDPLTVPVPLRQLAKAADLALQDLSPAPIALGSFWAESKRDLQSQIVKFFKAPQESPAALALIRAYAETLAECVKDFHPQGITRVLASRETRPDPNTPLSLSATELGKKLDIPFVEPFFRTESRTSMRDNPRLSGPDKLKPRIEYVLQDLCILPRQFPSRMILLDDIFNLGASARVYTYALKRLCGTAEVLSVNLAATRFHGGKDGWGYLSLDVSGLLDRMSLHLSEENRHLTGTCVVCENVIHKAGCQAAGEGVELPRFLVPAEHQPCPLCHRRERRRPWWQVGR